MEQSWIKKLIAVAGNELDPRELLRIYREDPGSLIADLYDSGHYEMTPEADSSPPVHTMSRCEAMRALVGRDNWRQSPGLQTWMQKARQALQ